MSHADLVHARQDGRFICYATNYEQINALLGLLSENCCGGKILYPCDDLEAQEEEFMKRFHVHMSVSDLSESIVFYSKLFGAEPTVLEPDYAKWMLEDPRINFAISTRDQLSGVNHLGFQVDSDEELRRMQTQLRAADAHMIQEDEQPCCYARSDKYWVTDPSGVAWETFHTLASIPVFGEDTSALGHGAASVTASTDATNIESACCMPKATRQLPAERSKCCTPNDSAT